MPYKDYFLWGNSDVFSYRLGYKYASHDQKREYIAHSTSTPKKMYKTEWEMMAQAEENRLKLNWMNNKRWCWLLWHLWMVLKRKIICFCTWLAVKGVGFLQLFFLLWHIFLFSLSTSLSLSPSIYLSLSLFPSPFFIAATSLYFIFSLLKCSPHSYHAKRFAV